MNAAVPPAGGSEIAQVDPRAGYLEQRDAIDAAIARVMAAGAYVLGPDVDAFETAFARYLGIGHAVGVANGTDAIALALRALGVAPGDRVATVSHTAVPTVAAIAMTGAVPVWVDVDPIRRTMDPAGLEAALRGPRVAAIVVVHLYGQPADLDAIGALARRHGTPIVEDCAQAHGARWRGRQVGTVGDVAAFSFYPTKNLGAFGDGGLAATDDAALAARLRALRQYGWDAARISGEAGVNSRLHALQAAILGVRLPRLDDDNARRIALADGYDALLADLPLERPRRFADSAPVFHQYAIEVDARDALRDALAARGVATGVHYPVPAHLQPAFRDLPRPPGGLPVTERLASTVLSLPMYPQLGEARMRRVAAAVREALSGR
ncbi:MAG: DegT/DnrJ/EryC1/StrS family aminotransferase [Burkholderiales bacterium]